MTTLDERFSRIRTALASAADGRPLQLLAVSKTQPAAAVRALAALGQRAFGENYVQEALAKQRELGDLDLEWHLIGPLQSNKCREAATRFDWVQTIDREKLIPLLARFRPTGRLALNLLVQVNIDDEASKSGCAPGEIDALADAIAALPQLRLRGLMAIPQPTSDRARRRDAFGRMRELFDRTRTRHAQVDTLSMGMSDDFVDAIAEGANLVRIGSALFGPRQVS
ncbi:MAG: YggS family pyridoxal phosphate-dependent enzyme [Xanthomonadales bacterium]|nr:YggS family pyridoxal phosphate-dependent enzyme [Xanthomonadales bacterium]